MKAVSVLCAFALALGCSSALAKTYHNPHGSTVGPVVIANPTSPTPTDTIINDGTIAGGPSTALTITGSTPTTTTNNGTITSNTRGVSVSGASSSISNNGSIIVKNVSTGTASATGISQGH
jgi:hypothetical protein